MNRRAQWQAGFTLVELLVVIAIISILAAILFPVFAGVKEKARQATCMSNLRQLGTATNMYLQDFDETYPAADPTAPDWGPGPWGEHRETVSNFRSVSRWIPQLLPYVHAAGVFACPSDPSAERNVRNRRPWVTPFPVSYGPNRFFVNPQGLLGGPATAVALANVDQPSAKYFMGDCAASWGFSLDHIANLRYANYDPGVKQRGWSEEEFRSNGRVAITESETGLLARHLQGSSVMFADGHVQWLRHDQIPNNRPGRELERLMSVMIPWQPVFQP
jgi:prepilin-type N-terminal cleavage/methylation domain-containing protein/prepilin-type processing-associated H-X9-DG protein